MKNESHFRNAYLKNDKSNLLFLLFIVFFYAVIYMTNNCFSAALAQIVAEGTMTKAQTGLMTSGFYLFYGALQLTGGMLADKYNPKTILKIGLFLSAIINSLIFFFNGFYEMLILWSLNGIIQMANYPCVFKILTSRLAPSWRKRGIFCISFAGSIGLIFGYIIAAFVTKWQYNFLVAAISIVAMVFALEIAYKRSDKDLTEDVKAGDTITVETKPIPGGSVFKLFAISGFIGILPVFLLRTFADLAVKTFTAPMLMESYPGLGVTVSNLLTTFVILAGVIGTVLTRKWTSGKTVKNEMKTVAVLFVAVLPFLGLLFLTGKAPVALIIFAVCMVSAILSGILLLCNFITGYFSVFGKSGTAAGIYNMAASLGVVVQSYGTGFVADHFGWKAVTVLYIAIVVLSVLITAFIIPVWARFKEKEALH
ncbi:MAG: MFS transporter [Clostridia bacterium]|nr:MFS transporter [Clostridia bacterium]